MAQDLVINGVTYNGVESLEIPNAEGKEVKYVEEDSVKLPELTNPGAAADLLEGTQLIDAEGKVVEGAMPDNQPETVVLDNSNQRYTIPAGKHDGTGVVKINACMKEFTPTKENQFYESDDGVVCTEVLVYSIPDKYQDVTPVTTEAAHVLEGDVFVDAEGNVVEGTMVNKSSENLIITPANNPVTIPEGYYDGTSQAGVRSTTVTMTPIKETQVRNANPLFFTKVTVNPIPDEYQDVSGVTATAEDVAAGKVFVDAEGNVVTGTAEAGSGGSVETVTVTIESFDANIQDIRYVSYENGNYKYVHPVQSGYSSRVTLENVPRGGYVYVYSSYGYCGWECGTGEAFFMNVSMSYLEFLPLSNCTIQIIDDD